jgi:hypothetical protein
VGDERVDIAYDHRSFRDEPEGRVAAGERFNEPPRQPVAALDWLVRIGGCPERHVFSSPRWTIEFALQHLYDVVLDQNHRRELVVRIHFELHVIPACETVVASVGAPAVRVQRPAEGHALDAIQGGLAGNLLVARLIRQPLRLSERVGSAAFDRIGDSPRGGLGCSEIEEEGK